MQTDELAAKVREALDAIAWAKQLGGIDLETADGIEGLHAALDIASEMIDTLTRELAVSEETVKVLIGHILFARKAPTFDVDCYSDECVNALLIWATTEARTLLRSPKGE